MVSIRVALFKDSIQIKITNCVRYIFCSNTVYQLLSSTFRMVCIEHLKDHQLSIMVY